MSEIMNDPQLDHYLQTHYQNRYGSPPDSRLMWERVAPHLASRKQSVPWWNNLINTAGHLRRPQIAQPTLPVRRKYAKPGVLAAGIIVCLLLMLATTAYAFSIPVLDGLLKDLGIQQLQYSDFHQSKSIDGYTLSLDKVYADANLVIVGYTIAAPAGQHGLGKFDMGRAKLATEQGLDLPALSGITAQPIGGINGNVLYFDASPIQGAPTDLHLRLVIPSTINTHESVSFDFSVPFQPGRIVNANQSVTAHAKTLTIDRIVVTPSETRIYMQGFNRQDRAGTTLFLANLTVGNHTYAPNGVGYKGSGPWMINFDWPLFKDQGVWTVTLHEFVFLKGSQPGQFHRVPVKGADWVFHVTVPGA